MFDNIVDNATISLITFFLGLFLGHWLTLGRDRRKEFNDLSRDTYRSLCKQVKTRGIEKVAVDIVVLRHYFWPVNRYRFVKAAQRYKDTKHDSGKYDPITEINTPNEKSTDELIKHAGDVSKFLTPR